MQKLIVGNLKMNMESVSQRDTYCKEFKEEFDNLKTEHVVALCPPTVYLEHFTRIFSKMSINIGAQDCFWELYGSYTGNTSPKTIKSLGAEMVVVGHSERRKYNHETNEDIAQKVAILLRTELMPIICVGYMESDDEMDSVRKQVEIIVQNFTTDDMENLVFAYEPVWAIGSGKTPTTDEIHTMIMFIRSIVSATHGKEVAENVAILYGGSVVAENVTEVCTNAYADGVLVGRASLSPNKFAQIARMLN
ncbi:MAG: triose-phosphate isomerase [Patescibacteria group bacterium]|nr:triose-phosphate isomerase [Patescibacteria group bacterium]